MLCTPWLAARKRRYLGRYFAHPMMQNRRAKRDDYKPSAALVTGHYGHSIPCSQMALRLVKIFRHSLRLLQTLRSSATPLC
ncbi:hypothetical protein [Piscirickettsia salmonis]|uniref:hypothetical protein n=1 Tax=Piscirickettsia salmonis TaxID=1238 RepID=UPI0012B8AFE3|nr:hypothetical protein [Piscirickettsia salmonis]